MHGGATNPAGHAYLVFSRLDTSNPKARVEVIDAIGQYGDPLDDHEWIQRMIFPGRLIGPGHLKQEHLRYIVEGTKYSHDHKTWPISEKEFHKLISDAEQIRGKPLPKRDFKDEYKFWQKINKLKVSNNPQDIKKLVRLLREEEMQAREVNGAHFNAFTKSCMTDAKNRIKSTGINIDDMEGYLVDLPIWTSGHVEKMELEYQKDSGKVYWRSPFVLFPRQHIPENDQRRQDINRLNTFTVLHNAINGIAHKFEQKHQALVDANKPNADIEAATKRLKQLQEEINQKALYPNRISKEMNHHLEEALKKTLRTCHRNLIKHDADSALIRFVRDVMDMFNRFVYHVRSYFEDKKVIIGLSPFGFAHRELNNLQEMDAELDKRYVTRRALINARG